jgi:hypothetical protein
LAPFLDQLTRARALVARERGPHGREAAVDLVDDLQVARQQQLEPRSGHFSSASGSSVWFV